MKRRTSAHPTHADLELSARQDLTDLGQTGQCAPVLQDIGEILWCHAQEVGRKLDKINLGYNNIEMFQENVSTTVNVLLTEPVLTTTAGLLVRMFVDRMRSVKQGTTAQSAPVHQDSLETPSRHADSPEDPRLMS